MAGKPTPIAAPSQIQAVPVSTGSNRVSNYLSLTTVPNPHGTRPNEGVVTDTQQITVIVPAGGTLRVNLTGISFYFPSVVSPLGINARPINAGQSRSFILYAQGTGLRLGTSSFIAVELSNPDAANTNPVTVVVGGGVPNQTYDEFIDKRVIVQNNPSGGNLKIQNGPTFVVGWKARSAAWADSIGAGANIQVTDGYNGKSRKAFTVCNNDNAALLTVQDANGYTIGTIQPSTAFYLETGGTFAVNNATAGAVSCNISEVYYS